MTDYYNHIDSFSNFAIIRWIRCQTHKAYTCAVCEHLFVSQSIILFTDKTIESYITIFNNRIKINELNIWVNIY